MVEELLNFEADNNIVDKSGKTAFDYAYERDNAKMAACLIYKDYKKGDCEKWFVKIRENVGFASRLASEIAALDDRVVEFSPPSSAAGSPRIEIKIEQNHLV